MAADNFKNCLPIILGFEGGRVNDRQDPGGRTNKGVTQRTYDAYRDRKGWKRADVYSIPDDEVADIYKQEYWDAIKGDALRSGEDLVVFDFAVNSGPARALRTGSIWEPSDVGDAIRGICLARLSFMMQLRTWRHFGVGWSRRVKEVQNHGLVMATGRPLEVKAPSPPIAVAGQFAVAGAAAVVGANLGGAPLVVTTATAIVSMIGASVAWAVTTRSRRMMAARAVVDYPVIKMEHSPQ